VIDPKLRPYLTFDYENEVWADEEEMMEKINSGRQLTSREEMTQEYFNELVFLLVSQMDSEYVGAYGYMPITYISPKVAASELASVSRIVHEEFKHGDRIRDILIDVDFDANKWIEDHWEEYGSRLLQGKYLTIPIDRIHDAHCFGRRHVYFKSCLQPFFCFPPPNKPRK